MSASLGFGVLFGAFILQLLIPALALLEYKAKRRIRAGWKRVRARPVQA